MAVTGSLLSHLRDRQCHLVHRLHRILEASRERFGNPLARPQRLSY